MGNKGVYTYPSISMRVPICYNTQKMGKKAVDTCPFMLDYILNCWKICEKSVSKRPYLLKCCLNRYKTQEICEKAVDASLQTMRCGFWLFWRTKNAQGLW